MSNTTVWNYDATGASTPVGEFVPQSINYEDFSKKETKADTAVLTNRTSPLDRPETVRFAYSKVANIYSGTSINTSVRSQNTEGASVLAQVNDVLTVTDTAGNRIDLPLSAHIVLKLPLHEEVTGAILTTLVKRLVGLLYEQSDASPDSRLASLARGAVLPRALA